ncbi:MAG: HMA2 domain-containing protein [Thiogranum sp.]
MVRIVHVMRGRLRLRLDAVKSRPGLAARLHAHLIAVSGIHRVEITPRTGSVLLTYDPRALGSAGFLDDLCTAMGMLFPAYFAPGRVRIRVDLFKGRPRLAQRIQQQLAPVEGIHRLEIDPSDGACLLVYDSRTVTSPEFIELMTPSLASLLPLLDVEKILSRTGLRRK